MDNKKRIFMILAIVALILVIITVSSVTFHNDDKNETMFVRNNTTDNVSNIDSDNADNNDQSNNNNQESSDSDSKSSSSQVQETGQYDSSGSPIYKTTATSEGGQESSGSHEVSWSENEGLI